MKNILKQGVVLVVLLTTLQSYASEIPSLWVLNESEETMLTFLNVKHGNQLIIKDTYGDILYNEKIKNVEEFVNRFNLSFLPDGEYSIELDKKLETVIIPVEIKGNNVVFKTKSAYVDSRKHSKVRKKEKPVELEKGVQRKISSFKGEDFLEYYNLK